MLNIDLTGIVLAGGQSSRFGSDKGLALYKGKELVTYSIELLRNFTKTILISTNNNDYQKFGYQIVNDIIKLAGPIGGIYSSLIASPNEHNLFLPCDMPYLNNKTLELLLAEIGEYNAIVIAFENEKLIPTIGYYNKNTLPIIHSFILKKQYKLHDLSKALNAKQVIIKDQALLKNINTKNEIS